MPDEFSPKLWTILHKLPWYDQNYEKHINMERTHEEGPGSLFIIQSSGSPFGLPFFGGSPALEKEEVLSPPWHS